MTKVRGDECNILITSSYNTLPVSRGRFLRSEQNLFKLISLPVWPLMHYNKHIGAHDLVFFLLVILHFAYVNKCLCAVLNYAHKCEYVCVRMCV